MAVPAGLAGTPSSENLTCSLFDKRGQPSDVNIPTFSSANVKSLSNSGVAFLPAKYNVIVDTQVICSRKRICTRLLASEKYK